MLGTFDDKSPKTIFETEIVICPTNTQPGVMGAGLALDCSRRFKGLKEFHRQATLSGEHAIGRPCWTRRQFDWPCEIILFPTKNQWRDPSRIEWIERGLEGLQELLLDIVPISFTMKLMQIGMPMLGCGLGGLDRQVVRPMLERFAHQCEHEVLIYG